MRKTLFLASLKSRFQKTCSFLKFPVYDSKQTIKHNQEDFEENIKFLEYYKDRNSSAVEGYSKGAIRDINLGLTLGVLEGSPLSKMDVYTVYPNRSNLWVSTVVPNLDYGERFRRRKLLGEIATKLGYDIRWNEKQMHFLEKTLDYWNSKQNESHTKK